MKHLYCICEPATARRVDVADALDGARVEWVTMDDLAVAVSDHGDAAPETTIDRVLTHERVIERVMAAGPVLPVRYGTSLASVGDVATVVSERRREWLAGLSAVRDAVELGVRVSDAEHTALSEESLDDERRLTDSGPLPSGRDYLLARVQRHERRQRAVEELHRPLAALALASATREASYRPVTLAASYLVARAAEQSFRARADELGRAHPGVTVAVTGPWPPYSFTDWDARAGHR